MEFISKAKKNRTRKLNVLFDHKYSSASSPCLQVNFYVLELSLQALKSFTKKNVNYIGKKIKPTTKFKLTL